MGEHLLAAVREAAFAIDALRNALRKMQPAQRASAEVLMELGIASDRITNVREEIRAEEDERSRGHGGDVPQGG